MNNNRNGRHYIFDQHEQRVIADIEAAFFSMDRKVCTKSIMNKDDVQDLKSAQKILKTKPFIYRDGDNGKTEAM